MAENIGTGIVEIKADAKGLGNDIAKQVDSEGDSVKKAGHGLGIGFGAAFKLAAGSAAVAAGVAFAKSAVGAASDLNESANAVNVTFGEAAGGIAQLSKEAATAVGLSSSEFNGLAVRFSSFAQTVAGDGGDVAGTMDEMTTRAADFASVMNLDVADAANLFQSGLAGESEPLRAYGLDISAAAVETFAYANGLAVAGEALTEQQKVQARYGLIMEQTAKTAGDFANTSDGLANRQRIMAAEFENVKAKIGAGLLPVLSAVVGFITTKVIPAFGKASEFVAKAFDFLKGGFTGEFTNEGEGVLLFLNQFGATVRVVFDGVAKAFEFFKGGFTGEFTNEGEGVLLFLNRFGAVVRTVADFVISSLPKVRDALMGAFQWIVDNREYVIAAVAGIAVVVASVVIPTFTAWVAVNWALVTSFIAANAPIVAIGIAIAALVAGVIWAYENWGWFRTAVDAVASFITDTLIPALQAVAGWIVDNVVPAIAAVVRWIGDNLVPAIGAVVSWINDNLVPAFAAVVGFIMDTLVPAFASIVNFIFDKVIPAVSNIISKFTEVASAVGTKVGEIVAFVVGIPGRIGDTVATMWDGLKNGVTAAKDWVGSAIDGIVSFARGLPGRINGFFSGMWDGIASAFKSAINSVIRGWNSLSFTLPSFDTHIPGVGSVGGFTVSTPDIGYLATGGVISQPMIAMMGEAPGARRNPEIVSPVRLMADTFRDVLRDGGGGGITINNTRRDLTGADLAFALRMNELMSPGSVVAA